MGDRAPDSAPVFVVVDLGFGDGGKGRTVDALARRFGDGRPVTVIRFNGGAQAGHNVVTGDGRHHCFSQFGAATFLPETRTWLGADVVVHPGALLSEGGHLERAGVRAPWSRIRIDERARLITPFHQAANRLREWARRGEAHGTCGVGFGETVKDSLEFPGETLRVADLAHPKTLLRTARTVQARKLQELKAERRATEGIPATSQERTLLEDPDVPTRWVSSLAPLVAHDLGRSPEHLAAAARDELLICEGAQGALLDEWRGFHPHTTWSTCTSEPALQLLGELGVSRPVLRLGATRSYTTRHGAGPMPSEAPRLDALEEPHNSATGWQGAFRRGHLDGVLLRYAAAVSPVDGLVITHLDRAPRTCVTRYRSAPTPFLLQGSETTIRLGPSRDLVYQEQLTQALFHVDAEVRQLRCSIPTFLEEHLQLPVLVTATGPAAPQTEFHPDLLSHAHAHAHAHAHGRDRDRAHDRAHDRDRDRDRARARARAHDRDRRRESPPRR